MCTPVNKKPSATENANHVPDDERFLRQFFTNYCNRRSRLVKDDSEDTLSPLSGLSPSALRPSMRISDCDQEVR